jgi:MFS family permease
LTTEKVNALNIDLDKDQLKSMIDKDYDSDVDFKMAIKESLGTIKAAEYESELIKAGINMNPTLILFGIIGFVASFAISLGPVMWVLFSELFPNRIRGLAISFVGLINSAVSFMVQLVFPWELETLGNATTFLIYGVFAVLGLIFIVRKIPETKNKTLEQLEKELIKSV